MIYNAKKVFKHEKTNHDLTKKCLTMKDQENGNE